MDTNSTTAPAFGGNFSMKNVTRTFSHLRMVRLPAKNTIHTRTNSANSSVQMKGALKRYRENTPRFTMTNRITMKRLVATSVIW